MEQTKRDEGEREDEKDDTNGKPVNPNKGGDGAEATGTHLHKASEPAEDGKKAKKN